MDCIHMGYHYDMVTIGYDDDVFYDVCSVTQMSTISSCKRRFVGLFVMLFPHFLETLRKPLNVPTLTVIQARQSTLDQGGQRQATA